MKPEDNLSDLAKNKIYLIGKDVSRSKSKQIHEAIYKYLNVNLTYNPISLVNNDEVVKFLSDNPICNVTYPYKQFCYEYLVKAKRDKISRFCQAINLSIFGKLAYNLDGQGFFHFSQQENIELFDKSILICGTGATAKSIYLAIKNKVKHVKFASRTQGLKTNLGKNIIDYTGANKLLSNFDILIDARPISFSESLLDISNMNKSSLIIDVSYSDCDTGIINAAKENGLACYDGKGILVAQAVLSIYEICKELNLEISSENDFETLYNIGKGAICI